MPACRTFRPFQQSIGRAAAGTLRRTSAGLGTQVPDCISALPRDPVCASRRHGHRITPRVNSSRHAAHATGTATSVRSYGALRLAPAPGQPLHQPPNRRTRHAREGDHTGGAALIRKCGVGTRWTGPMTEGSAGSGWRPLLLVLLFVGEVGALASRSLVGVLDGLAAFVGGTLDGLEWTIRCDFLTDLAELVALQGWRRLLVYRPLCVWHTHPAPPWLRATCQEQACL